MITLVENSTYKLSAEVEGSTYYLHFDYKLPQFTRFIYKILLQQWVLILKELESDGIKEVKAIVPAQDSKKNKLVSMFGLEEYDSYSECVFYRRVI